MNFENNLAFAQAMDAADPLKHMRDKYLFPQQNTGSVDIAQTKTEAKNDATPAKKPLL